MENDKIKEAAKGWYFDCDQTGKRINSYKAISKKIQKKFKVEIDQSTIAKWCKSEGWATLYIQMKTFGINKAKTSIEKKEAEVIEQKGSILALLYESAYELYNLVSKSILEDLKNNNDTLQFRDKTKLLDSTIGTILKLNPPEEDRANEAINKLIASLDEETKLRIINFLGIGI